MVLVNYYNLDFIIFKRQKSIKEKRDFLAEHLESTTTSPKTNGTMYV